MEQPHFYMRYGFFPCVVIERLLLVLKLEEFEG